MITASVKGRRLTVTSDVLITSGAVGLTAHFYFDDEWDQLNKTAVFIGSKYKISVLLEDDVCAIPHEVVSKFDGVLKIGVHGESDSVVIPTIWAELPIYEGTTINYNSSEDPTPTLAQQLLDAVAEGDTETLNQIMGIIGNMEELITVAKSTLVAAINEAAQSGGGGGGSGTSNYNLLANKPLINNVELMGNKSASDLGLQTTLGTGSVTGSMLNSNVLPENVGFKSGTEIPTTSDISSGQVYLQYT